MSVVAARHPSSTHPLRLSCLRRCGFGLLLIVAALLLGPTAAQASTSCDAPTGGSPTFTVSCPVGADDAWTVPSGVDNVMFDVQGAGGGASTRPEAGGPGAGGRVQGTLFASPGTTFHMAVGAKGGDATDGVAGTGGALGGGDGKAEQGNQCGGTCDAGGGGGATSFVGFAPLTDDFHSLDLQLLGAGGGGGAGAGVPGADNTRAGGAGGDGGGLSGGDGGFATGCLLATGGDQNGTQGSGHPIAGGAAFTGPSGGGGGGLWGGAGGVASCGGGGGSGFIVTNVSTVLDSRFLSPGNAGGGTVTITYAADITPPTVTINLAPASPDGDNGWYVHPVGLSLSASDDSRGGVVRHCDLDPAGVPSSFDQLPSLLCSRTVSSDGLHTFYAAGEDPVDNTSAVVSAAFKIDATPPALAPTISPGGTLTPGQSATASPHATDATSGVATSSCDPVDTSTSGDHSVTCRATDNAGNTGQATIAYSVRDATPPQTTIALSPPVPDGANGWYVHAVTVAVTATDDVDPSPLVRCTLDPPTPPSAFGDLAGACPSSVSADGVHTLFAGSQDASGNASAIRHVSFNVDRTPPTLNPSVGPVSLHQTGINAAPNATDAASGVATSSCGAIDTSTIGDHTVTCTATDRAGNTANATIHYLVGYQILGFVAPGLKLNAGSTTPIKVALADSRGTRIPDGEAAAVAAAHRIKVSASGAQTLAPQDMTYSAATDQFQYDWHLGKPTGAETVSVTVSYPGTSATTVKTDVGTITK